MVSVSTGGSNYSCAAPGYGSRRTAAAFTAASKSAGIAQSGSLININTADEKELQNIRGIGPVIAGRIVEYRQQNGGFKSIDEIKKVRGIGSKTFEKMRDAITVN